jgi:urease accessory protein
MKLLKQNFWRCLTVISLIIIVQFLISAPVFAHHPLGGQLPSNFFEGIMSGLGHPVIGLDHLAFVIASGAIALKITGGIIIPVAFVIATSIGAGIHLAGINLPVPEIVIAGSVVLFGFLLAVESKKDGNVKYGLKIASLAAIFGIFHGFAYGEGIFGAETTPMLAYLIGFTIIQLAISLGTYILASKLINSIPFKYIARFAGSAIASIGVVFLSSAILG